MKERNRFLKWLKRPRGVGLVAVYIFTLAAIIASIAVVSVSGGKYTEIVAYALFAATAVSLGYSIYTIVIYAPSIKQKIIKTLKKRKLTAAITEHYGTKTLFFALISLAMTLFFAIINGISAIKYKSLWYGALFGYYVMLILFRAGITISAHKCGKLYADDEKKTELCGWKIYLAGGAFLVILDLSMAAVVTQMMIFGRPTQSGQIMAIGNAAYTFYKAATAISNIIKARRFDNPVTQALRNVNFADACMSVASLTVIMVSTFGGDGDLKMTYVKAAVGFFACALIIATSSIMIIKANKKIKELKGRTDNEGD